MSVRVKRVDHVEVMVRSIPRTERWYREILGLRRMRSWVPEPVMIGAGGTKLALFRARGGRGLSAAARSRLFREPGYRRIAFLTDRAGFLAVQSRLRRRGIEFRGPIDHRGSHSIYFVDPDGLPVEVTRLSPARRRSSRPPARPSPRARRPRARG